MENRNKFGMFAKGHKLCSGKKNPMYGKKHTNSWRKNHSNKMLRRKILWADKISDSLSGKKFSEKHKKALCESHVDFRGIKNPFYGRKHTIKAKQIMKIKKNTSEAKIKLKEKRAKQIFPIKDTKIEVKIQTFLKKLGINFFTHQYIKDIKHGYQCDILIPSINLVIECDGNYWHKYPFGKDIDKIRTSELIEKGFKVLRLWESEIKIMKVNEFEKRLGNLL